MNAHELLTHVSSVKDSKITLKNGREREFKSDLSYILRDKPELHVSFKENPHHFVENKYRYFRKNFSQENKITLNEDFISSFKSISYHNAYEWKNKMSLFYGDKIVWTPYQRQRKPTDSFYLDENLESSIEKIREYTQDYYLDKDSKKLNKLISHFGYSVLKEKEQRKTTYRLGVKKSMLGFTLDPDAIMVIQQVDTEGNVSKSYIRNPDIPWKILVFEGEEGLDTYQGRQHSSIINLLENK